MKTPRKTLLSSSSPSNPTSGRWPWIPIKEAFPYLLVFVAVVAIVVFFLRWHIKSSYEEEVLFWQARLTGVADDQAQRVSDWLKERQGDARVTSSRPSLRAVLRDYNEKGQLPKSLPVRQSDPLSVLDEIATSYSYAGVYILDRDGHMVMQSSHSIPLNPLFAASCRTVARSGVERDELAGDTPSRTLMGFIAPVFPEHTSADPGQSAGQPLGSVLLVSDASPTLFPMVTREVIPSRTGESVLVRREGDEVVYFSPLRHISAGSPSPRFPLSIAPVPAKYALEGRQTYAEYNDYRGAPVLAATQGIPRTRWGLVRKIDRAEALEDFHRSAFLESLAAGLLIILLCGLLLLLRSYIVTRVRKREEEKFRALLESAPDAIYIIEPATLRIQGRNRKAQELDGYSDDEISRMHVTDLHPPEDNALIRERIEKGAGSAGLSPLQTLHLRRHDGQLVPVEVSQTQVGAGGERLVLTIARDITDRKQADAALRESEEHFRSLFENMLNGFAYCQMHFEHDQPQDFTYLDVNHAFETLTGLKNVVGRKVSEVVPGLRESDPDVFEMYGRVALTGVPERLETFVDALGMWYSIAAYSPKKEYFVAVFEVISERKQAEEALRESERKYRQLHESMMDGFVRVNMDGRITEANTAFCQMLGYKSEELLHLSYNDLTPEKWHVVEARVIEDEVLPRGYSEVYSKEYQQMGGAVIPVEVRKYLLLDESGNACGMWATVRDITERKWAEQMRQEYEQVVEGLDEMIAVVDREYRYLLANAAFLRQRGMEREDVVGSSVQEVVGKEDFEKSIKEKLDECFQGNVVHYEMKYQYPKLGERDILVSCYPIEGDLGVDRVAVVYQDVTERKRAEAETARLAVIVNSSDDAIFSTTQEGIISTWNTGAERMYGYNGEEIKGKHFSIFIPEGQRGDLAPIREKLSRAEAVLQIEHENMRKDGSRFQVSLTLSPIKDAAGVVTGASAIVRNVSERRQAEEALRENEKRYRDLVESSHDWVWQVDENGIYTYAGPQCRGLLGYEPEEIIGKTPFDLMPPEEQQRTDQIFGATIAQRAPFREFEKVNLHKDGHHVIFETNGVPVIDGQGVFRGYRGMNRDITEHKRADVALQMSERELAQAMDMALLAHWEFNPTTGIFTFNDRFYALYGTTAEREGGYQMSAEAYTREFLYPEDVQIVADEIAKALATTDPGAAWALGHRIRRRDGEMRHITVHISVIKNSEGLTIKTRGVNQDITERKWAEEGLIAERHLLHTVMDNLPDKIYFKDRESCFTRINLALATSFGLGHPSQAVGKTDFDFYLAEHAQEAYGDEQEIIRTGQPMVGKEEKEVWPDGHVTWVSTTKMPQRDASGNIIGTFGVSRDITDRKRVDDALSESEGKYRSLVSNIPDVVWTLDANLCFAFISKNIERMSGFSVDDVVQHGADMYLASLHPDDVYKVKDGFRALFAEGRPYDVECRVRRKDGEWMWVHDRALATYEKNGMRYADGLLSDITERKRAEEALRESEERFRSLVENATVGIYRTTPQGRILMANSALVRMLGYANFEALAARKLEGEGFEPGYPRRLFRERMEQDGEVSGLEEAWTRQDGTVIFVRESGRAVQSQDGKTLYYDGVVEDITGERRAEAEHVRLVTAIEQSAEGVVITNTRGDIEYVNPAFTRITGYSREEVLGQNPRVLKSGKHDLEFYHHLWETILKGQTWQGELTNQRKDGSHYTEQMSVTPIVDSRGEITHFIATKQDVTERRTLEAQLHQASKMQAVGRLAGGVAHDFNNLLTVINGYAEILMEMPVLDTKSSGYLKEIYNAGERAASLTRQLLAFSRHQVLAPQILDLNAVVSNLEKMLRRLIGEDVKLHTLLNPSLARVKADPGQIEQVIMNLAVNARDAMPKGGDLAIETSNVELDAEYARSHPTVKPGPHVVLVVSDTGVGMTPETQGRIFEPFFTTKEMGQGTGLGLATVYGIVKQSGGSVWVYSEVGRGTTFKIYFPVVSDGFAVKEPPKLAMDSASGTETVLVVEDEEGVRSLVRLALVSGGYKVLETPDAESALAICSSHDGPIHLLLTDVVMPQMSGPEVASKVAGLRPGIKVLYMSGYTDDAVVHHGVLSQDMPFIQKPFSPVSLRKKIREVLGGNKG